MILHAGRPLVQLVEGVGIAPFRVQQMGVDRHVEQGVMTGIDRGGRSVQPHQGRPGTGDIARLGIGHDQHLELVDIERAGGTASGNG